MAPVELESPGSRIKVTVSPGENFSMLLNWGKDRGRCKISKIKVQVKCSNDDQKSEVATSLVEGRPTIKLGPLQFGFREERTFDGTARSVAMRKGDEPIKWGLETEDLLEFKHR